MPTRVVIIGDLPGRPVRNTLLAELARKHPAIEWEWLQPVTAAFSLPKNPFNRLLADLRDEKIDRESLKVVKLSLLNGRDQNALYTVHRDPIEPPRDLGDINELVAWLLSEDATIIGQVWKLPVRAAALMAILSKLIRNKSWNKDAQGHQWTTEINLLGQAPVSTPNRRLYGEARGILGKSWPLLFSKGGKQGKTPLGWCIQISYLPAVKQVISSRSLCALQAITELSGLIDYILDEHSETVVVDDKIVSQRVRAICRDQHI